MTRPLLARLTLSQILLVLLLLHHHLSLSRVYDPKDMTIRSSSNESSSSLGLPGTLGYLLDNSVSKRVDELPPPQNAESHQEVNDFRSGIAIMAIDPGANSTSAPSPSI